MTATFRSKVTPPPPVAYGLTPGWGASGGEPPGPLVSLLSGSTMNTQSEDKPLNLKEPGKYAYIP